MGAGWFIALVPEGARASHDVPTPPVPELQTAVAVLPSDLSNGEQFSIGSSTVSLGILHTQ